MIPRHGAGLFGVGASLSVSLYLAVLISETISLSFKAGTHSFIDSMIRLVSTPTTENIIMGAIFFVSWIFLGAVAIAGGSRYLIGCVDPKHIAQRTFFNGVRFYFGRMIAYTIFISIMGISSLFILWAIVQLGSANTTIGANNTYIVTAGILFLLFLSLVWSKLAYVPYFLISGDSFFACFSKSWVATKKRIWTIWFLRCLLVVFVIFPVAIKYIISPGAALVPSLSVWPFIGLIVWGYVELIVVRGYQEWIEIKKLPIITTKFKKDDLSYLDNYSDGHISPKSMEL